jgi:hypothetical protein
MKIKLLLTFTLAIALTISVVSFAVASLVNESTDGMQSEIQMNPAVGTNIDVPRITYWVDGERGIITNPAGDGGVGFSDIFVGHDQVVMLSYTVSYKAPAGKFGEFIIPGDAALARPIQGKILTPGQTKPKKTTVTYNSYFRTPSTDGVYYINAEAYSYGRLMVCNAHLAIHYN